jgi:FemAB-related protein (PEP-CTERM system-associated)
MDLPVTKTQVNYRDTFAIEHDCSDRRRWDDYISNHATANNYHRYGWRDVIERSFQHSCYYMAARENDGGIVGVLPLVYMKSKLFGRFLVSQPFFNYGGMLCNNSDIGSALLREADNLRNKLGAEHVELRHIEPCSTDLPTKQHKVSMVLNLAIDVESQWQGFNAKLRNQVRKAEKSGLSAVVGSAELIADFYTVFVRNMRDLGTPVYGEKFFAEVLEAFPDSTRIIAVYLEGKPVAAGLITWFRDTVEIPWASSIRDYNPLCPNNLLYWTALQYALTHGFKRFDFGRSTPNEGTFNFKKQWGAVPVPLHWHYLLPEGASLPELNTKNPKFDMAIRVWQKLPLVLTRILGPQIVRNIP